MVVLQQFFDKRRVCQPPSLVDSAKQPRFRVRKKLPHEVPLWLDSSREIFFITINCKIRGSNQLCLPEVGSDLLGSVAFRHEAGQWHVRLFLLMPDHIHALLSFPSDGGSVQRTIASWKGWTAKKCKVSWQRDFFEHRLRTEESLGEKALYIRSNPDRAGLIVDPDKWRWVIWSDPHDGKIVRG